MDRVGKYQIVEQIGAGGFSEVFKGFDPHIKRHVAIKSCTANDAELRSRFFQEAQIAGNLQHKNIVTVFDFGFEDAMPYLVQEYLSGEDLDRKIKRGDDIPIGVKVDILHQIALGLRHAHEQKIVHRDIKPGNVRVLEDGTAKIMDFGIAKVLQQETGLTKTGMTVGTAAYLAPEQIRGRSADPRTDVFSFGVLAYELLTLTRPFAGEQISAVLYQILNEEPPHLDTRAEGCPPLLDALVMRCLRKERDERPANGAALVRALEDIGRRLSQPAAESLERITDLVTQPVAGTTGGLDDVALRPDIDAPASGTETPRAAAVSPRRWPAVVLVILLVAGAIGWLARYELMPGLRPRDAGPTNVTAPAEDPPTAVAPDPAPAASGLETAAPDPMTADGEGDPTPGSRPDAATAAAGAEDEAGTGDEVRPGPGADDPATASDEPAAAPPPPPATLVVPSAWDPSITVTIGDGTPQPLAIAVQRSLPPGRHRLTFRIDLPGYRSVEVVEIDAVPGRRIDQPAPFPPGTGLVVQAKPGTPPGIVRVGDEVLGEGRRVALSLFAPGRHRVEITPLRPADGVGTVSGTIELPSGGETFVTYDLTSGEPPAVRQRRAAEPPPQAPRR